MVATLALFALALACAFLMGFALNQGSTCAVTAAHNWIHKGQFNMMLGFVVAVGAAGLIWLTLTGLTGGHVRLVGELPITTTLILGACLLGVGAIVNDACLLGSLSRIGHGEIRFLAMPVGLAAGFAFSDRILAVRTPSPAVSVFEGSGTLIASLALVFGLVVLCGIWILRGRQDRGDLLRWPLWVAMLVLGVTGAILFAIVPGWTYADFVRNSVAPHRIMSMATGLAALTAALTMVAGTITAGVVGKTFRYSRPDSIGIGRSLLGGGIMAIGATLVPGGNDSLLLAAVPSATLSGLVAYLTMSATVMGVILALRRLSLTAFRPPVSAPPEP